MGVLYLLLCSFGVLFSIIGGIWILVLAFRTSVLWGLGSFFVPFVGLIFVIKHWHEAKAAFLISLVGSIMYGISFDKAMANLMDLKSKQPQAQAQTNEVASPNSVEFDPDKELENIEKERKEIQSQMAPKTTQPTASQNRPKVLDDFIKMLKDKSAKKRKAAAEGIGMLAQKISIDSQDPAIASLIKMIEEDQSDEARKAAALALGEIGKSAKNIMDCLHKALYDKNPEISKEAEKSISKIKKSLRQDNDE